jgi:hypothetical protein
MEKGTKYESNSNEQDDGHDRRLRPTLEVPTTVTSDRERPKLAIQHNHSPPPDDTRSISEGKVSEHYWWGMGLPT